MSSEMMMNDTKMAATGEPTHAKLIQAAVAAGWAADEVRILPNQALDTAGCAFFRAVHTRIMDGSTLELAVLPDGSVVGGDPAKGDGSAGARILSACGQGATAQWWAEVVAKFSGRAPGKVVKSEKNAADVNRILKQGGAFAPPSLERDGDRTQVRFFVIQYEPTRAAEVVAVLSGGQLSVTSRPLAAE